MNGPEHWSEAGQILTDDPCEYGCPHSGCPHEMRQLVRAQAHATLALAAAVIAGATMRPEDRDEWDRATGRVEDGNPGGADPDRPDDEPSLPECGRIEAHDPHEYRAFLGGRLRCGGMS